MSNSNRAHLALLAEFGIVSRLATQLKETIPTVETGELAEAAVVSILESTPADGKRTRKKKENEA